MVAGLCRESKRLSQEDFLVTGEKHFHCRWVDLALVGGHSEVMTLLLLLGGGHNAIAAGLCRAKCYCHRCDRP